MPTPKNVSYQVAHTMTIGDKLRTHRLKLTLFVIKLSKRPYQKLKDYLITVKPRVKTTTFYTLLLVTYVSIGETALVKLVLLSKSAKHSLFHYK